ncbi:E3 ubiquitin-protein ligase rnf8 [Nymphon striatum]|nr:E3 ubiquitin-protein ligase rnf8 [Nymphon striatum]
MKWPFEKGMFSANLVLTWLKKISNSRMAFNTDLWYLENLKKFEPAKIDLVTTEVTLGRAISCFPQYVSRNHALFKFIDGRWTVTDLKSGNGVFVNSNKIDPSLPVCLSLDDLIGLAGANSNHIYKLCSKAQSSVCNIPVAADSTTTLSLKIKDDPTLNSNNQNRVLIKSEKKSPSQSSDDYPSVLNNVSEVLEPQMSNRNITDHPNLYSENQNHILIKSEKKSRSRSSDDYPSVLNNVSEVLEPRVSNINITDHPNLYSENQNHILIKSEKKKSRSRSSDDYPSVLNNVSEVLEPRVSNRNITNHPNLYSENQNHILIKSEKKSSSCDESLSLSNNVSKPLEPQLSNRNISFKNGDADEVITLSSDSESDDDLGKKAKSVITKRFPSNLSSNRTSVIKEIVSPKVKSEPSDKSSEIFLRQKKQMTSNDDETIECMTDKSDVIHVNKMITDALKNNVSIKETFKLKQSVIKEARSHENCSPMTSSKDDGCVEKDFGIVN